MNVPTASRPFNLEIYCSVLSPRPVHVERLMEVIYVYLSKLFCNTPEVGLKQLYIETRAI